MRIERKKEGEGEGERGEVEKEGEKKRERGREEDKERENRTHARGRALADTRHAYMHAGRARIPQDCRKNCTGEAQQRANRTARESSALASRVPNHSTTR